MHLSLRTDCQYLVSVLFNSYYRRFADNNTLILAMHQRICSALEVTFWCLQAFAELGYVKHIVDVGHGFW